ncbi:zf-HC2 domain-containing protein [Undibacterium sp. Jales W-56]|uniref:anti-sigma factor family protein n=1 Tax=Undibacterium sp. Jales W-56 TaxID=2897325 RepID=UPI0021CFA354|nr:zf-HC2 domain-containing protein [Undibacterium sp. Jales W-56]MCU6434027.1 zf-HC2 domain-containing protein [Undibacterium sp. Jales W-56]
MNTQIHQIDPDTHELVQALLPWFVAQTLDAREFDQVQRHLSVCPQCRAESEALAVLKGSGQIMHSQPDVDQALARLLPRLNQPASPLPRIRQLLQAGWDWLCSQQRQWRPAVLALQSVVIAGLIAYIAIPQKDSPQFHALSSPNAPSIGNIVVVFKPDAKISDIQNIMHRTDARIVDGPTVADAYLLSVDPKEQNHIIEQLRAESSMQLVESLDAKSAP